MMVDYLGRDEAFTMFAPNDFSLHKLSSIFQKYEEKRDMVSNAT